MTDEFKQYNPALNSPAEKAAAITPNDGADLAATTRAIYVGTAGDLAVILVDDANAVTFANVPVGIIPIRARRVLATGTTASDLVALS